MRPYTIALDRRGEKVHDPTPRMPGRITSPERRWVRCGSGLAGLSMLIGACLAEPPPFPDPEPLPPLAESPEVTAPEPASVRVEAIADVASCIRRTAIRIEQSWERLQVDIDIETGRRRRSRRDVQPYVIPLRHELAPCRRIDATQLEGLSDPVREAFTAYREITETFATLTIGLSTYYSSRGYEADGWAYGIQTVGELEQVFGRWSSAAARLREALDPALAEVGAAVLTQADADDDAMAALAVVLAARAFERCVRPDDVKPKACSDEAAQLARMSQVARELDRFAFGVRAFQRQTERFVTAAAEAHTSLTKGRLRDAQRMRVQSTLRALANASDALVRG